MRNGSGTYQAPSGSFNPATNGNSATAADWNTLLADLVAAMTQSVSADGQTPITGNFNMGNNKLTNLGVGNASGQSLAWQQLFSQGTESDLPSATTTDIGAQNTNFLRITGTTTITSFGTNYNGPRFLRFAGALTLTHNATTLILPTGANITTAAGDCCIALPISGGWYVAGYQRTNGGTLTVNPISSGGTGQVTAPAALNALGGINAIFRNAVINGDFSSDQEYAGTSQTVTASAVFKSVADCWYGICSGANITAQRVQLSDKSYRLRFTGAASVTLVAAGHRIRSEEVAARRMPGSKASIGVLLSSSSLTSITWRLYRANTENAFGTRASPTRTLIESGTFAINSTETRYTATTAAVLPTTAQEGLELEFEGGALLGTQTLTIGDVQLEKSDVATPFETMPEIQTLLRAQTQIATSYAKGTAIGTATLSGALSSVAIVGAVSSSAQCNIFFPVAMAATPTITYYNPVTGASGTWRTGAGGNTSLGDAGFTANSRKTTAANLSVGMSANEAMFGHYMAKAYLF